ncbi:MAG: ATP-dependent zinc protease [Flammeovirgaceae bacterium]
MKIIIGRTDKADFPELYLEGLGIKIDTGAYTSAIHCHDIEEVEVDGKKRIKFQLLDPSHPKYNHKAFVLEHYTKKVIKSSTGHAEERFVIQSSILLFGNTYPIKLSLSERSDMKYPVLLGRRFLSKKFIVDPALMNLSHKYKKSQK